MENLIRNRFREQVGINRCGNASRLKLLPSLGGFIDPAISPNGCNQRYDCCDGLYPAGVDMVNQIQHFPPLWV